MNNIEKRYIDEAIRIREKYLNLLNELNNNENLIFKIKDNLNISYNMVKSIKNDIDKELLENKINVLSNDITLIKSKIEPIIENIENLKISANLLYENLKEKYPNIQKETLIDILKPYMEKIDKKYNIFK